MPTPRRPRGRTPEAQAAADTAQAEIKRLRAAMDATAEQLEKDREALAEAIVKHLKARTVTPSEAARSADYDPKHVGRMAKAAGVPPLRPPTVTGRTTPDSE